MIERRWRKYLELTWLVLGLGLLAYVISREPLGDIWVSVSGLGWTVCLSPVVALCWFPTHTTALWVLLDRKVPWIGLLYNRLVGDGYNAVMPMAGMGGEPFKLAHLSKFVPPEIGVAALVRDRVIDNGLGFAFSAGWLVVTVPVLTLPAGLAAALWGYVAIAGVLAALSAWLVVTRLPGRFGRRLGKWLSGASEEPPRLRPLVALQAAGWSVASRLLGLCETAVLLHAIGAPVSLVNVAFIDSALNAAGFIGFAFPQGIGVFEGSSVYLLGLLGVSGPAALAYALARRGRILAISLFGVALHGVATLVRRRRGTN